MINSNRFARSPYPRGIPGEWFRETEGMDRYHPGKCGNPGNKSPIFIQLTSPKRMQKSIQTFMKIYKIPTKISSGGLRRPPSHFVTAFFEQNVQNGQTFFAGRVPERLWAKFKNFRDPGRTPKNSPERLRTSIWVPKLGSRTPFGHIYEKTCKITFSSPRILGRNGIRKQSEFYTAFCRKIRAPTCWQRGADMQNLS